MNNIYIFLLCLLGSAVQAQNQSERIRYVIVTEENDNQIDFAYEIENLDDANKNIYPENLDAFLSLLFADLSDLPVEKRQVLFYIHGMWGGKGFAFNRTYNMMEDLYLNPISSDIGRIVSIKWPGNQMMYKANKQKLYKIVPAVSTWFDQFLIQFYFHSYLRKTTDIRLDLLAHSLGTELIKEILCRSNYNEYNYCPIDQMVLASPDLECSIFETEPCFSERINMAKHTHIYYSSRDLTLGVSNTLNNIDRLGRFGPTDNSNIPSCVTFIEVTEIKDETNISDLLTGHSSFRASPQVSNDILSVLTENKTFGKSERELIGVRQRIFKLKPFE